MRYGDIYFYYLGKIVMLLKTYLFDKDLFGACSEEDKLKKLGDLMNESHQSCSILYECR